VCRKPQGSAIASIVRFEERSKLVDAPEKKAENFGLRAAADGGFHAAFQRAPGDGEPVAKIGHDEVLDRFQADDAQRGDDEPVANHEFVGRLAQDDAARGDEGPALPPLTRQRFFGIGLPILTKRRRSSTQQLIFGHGRGGQQPRKNDPLHARQVVTFGAKSRRRSKRWAQWAIAARDATGGLHSGKQPFRRPRWGCVRTQVNIFPPSTAKVLPSAAISSGKSSRASSSSVS